MKMRQVTRQVVSSELNLERSKYLRKRTIQAEGKHEKSTLCLEAGRLTGLTELKSSLSEVVGEKDRQIGHGQSQAKDNLG